ncbi:MAG: multicomponent Na+:H+ antiporter subunit D [Verrucomicrobiales bacterium]|jgi:multicomponent Na+:H+ antiporter subunit D
MTGSPEPWLVLIPLCAAVLTFLCTRASALIGLIAAVINGGLVLWLITLLKASGVRSSAIGGWQAPLGIELYADGLSAWMLLIAAILGIATPVYACRFFEGRKTYFWPCWLLMMAAVNGLFLARDVFNLYVTLELLGLSSVAMIALSDSRDALAAALRYFFVSMLGSLCYLLGVALLYGAYSTVDIDGLRAVLTDSPMALVAGGFMTVGLLLKTALFPMHFWLPPAHANAPAPVSALLSGLVVKASFYILLRLWFEVFPAAITSGAANLIGILGGVAVIWGGMLALSQDRVKLIVTYSTVVQIGYFFLLFPLTMNPASADLARQGVIYMLLAHAVSKAAAFYAAGNFLYALGSDRLEDLKGAGRAVPVSMFAFGLAGVSLMGLPPSAGFIGKWKMLTASIEAGQWWYTVVLLAGGLLAAGYFFRVLALAFQEPSKECVRIPATMQWAAMGLALAGVALGFLAPQLLELLEIGAPLRPLQMGGNP